VGDLKGRARRWLGQARSPFERMQQADVDAANELRVLRNLIVHRSRQSEQTYEERLLRRRSPQRHSWASTFATATRRGFTSTSNNFD